MKSWPRRPKPEESSWTHQQLIQYESAFDRYLERQFEEAIADSPFAWSTIRTITA